MKIEPTARPWQTDGAKNIWSPAARANIATVSDPYDGTTVGYHEVKIASPYLHEACANADLIVTAVNAYDPRKDETLKTAYEALRTAQDWIVKAQDEMCDRGFFVGGDQETKREIANALSLASEVMRGQAE